MSGWWPRLAEGQRGGNGGALGSKVGRGQRSPADQVEMRSRVDGDFAYEREALKEVVRQIEVRPCSGLDEVSDESYMCGMRLAG